MATGLGCGVQSGGFFPGTDAQVVAGHEMETYYNDEENYQ